MSRKKDIYEEDDGRTVSNMNVEGMPWYKPPGPEDVPEKSRIKPGELNKEETRAFIKGALSAALLVAFIFAAVFFLFILFLDKVLFA